MPLRAIDYGPGDRPAIVCDWCGKEITEVEDGNYHWDSQLEGGDNQAIYFSHKSDCAWHVDQKFGTTSCMGLDDFLLYLTHNLGFTSEKAEQCRRRNDLFRSL